MSIDHRVMGGLSTLENETGIFSEEFQTNGVAEAGRESARVQGKNVWSDDEIKDAFEYTRMSEFRYQSGTNAGKPNLAMIAEKLNEDYHNAEEVRTGKKVEKKLVDYRKRTRKRKDVLLDEMCQAAKSRRKKNFLVAKARFDYFQRLTSHKPPTKEEKTYQTCVDKYELCFRQPGMKPQYLAEIQEIRNLLE
ncbi:hypothetical protein HOE37_03300 [Candidatus Woesearchaeota archaeon]|jgi:hypothetical protein|nr:hypothetical protein [Candidatus Woesearchaeota archaeon]MBT4110856.1 hypothetical protein [Candidatus Woesearchaeota archaeon]MBT4336632.1 hypothetical protein [Candidatus Woesearchaeota archaeon]MBT4469619.1 hypothetical protein [Candidatus Woesearchaeota archaeon]MBT6743981.1 hypothetical protein [Candidatus Woesearchaeota archaeon]